jgi:hypothetical protein
LIGITHSLRQTGTGHWALAGYKLALTLDLPLQGVVLVGRYLWARLRRPGKQAERAWQDLCGLGWFVRHGLGAFWRA